ncbi:hypothetical protein HID58_074812, partial [Brassica napus]
IAEFVPFSSDKRYATTSAAENSVLNNSVYVALSCIFVSYYVTYGSLRSLYSTHELAGVSVAIMNFLQRI